MTINTVFASDPTILKGELKAIFEKKVTPVKDKQQTKLVKPTKKMIHKKLQDDIDKLVFKAFYTKDSTKRLMLELDESLLLLERQKKILRCFFTTGIVSLKNE